MMDKTKFTASRRNIFFAVLFLMILSLPFISRADDLSISSYVNKTNVSLNSTLQLTVEVTADKNVDVDPFIPDLTGLKIIGQSTSSSTSIRITNGKSFRSIEKDFIYTLSPNKTGKIIIPSISVEYQGKSYKTEPITITVEKGDIAQDQRRNKRDDENYSKPTDSPGGKVFLRATATKNEVYVGEPFSVQYKIYSTENLTGLQAEKMPEFSNFLKKEVFQADNINHSLETLNGKRYYTYKISEYTLFPTTAGSFELDRMRLVCSYSVPSKSFFDFGTTKRKRLLSTPVNINVKSLPDVNKPAEFSGAIGSFTITSGIDKNRVKAGQSITYTLTISGSGNLDMFDLPRLPRINNVESFEPDTETKFTNSRKTTGQRILKYVLIPQEQGEFTIPAIEFSFFDTNSKSYTTISSSHHKFTATKPDKNYGSISITTPQGIQVQGSDIRFIRDNPAVNDYKLFYNLWWYWLIAILSVILAIFSFLYRKERDKRLQDRGYYRFKVSNKQLRKDMKQVRDILDSKRIDEFFPAAAATIKNFIANKCNFSASASTMNDILAKLEKNEASEDLKKKVRDFFRYSDNLRFGGSDLNQEIIKEKYNELQEIISGLQKIDFRRDS
ncbi:MAG: protein BatD [Candidatus Cloacimonetes bacterium]|nr:protein BatD [Candidatus Cloacimonadota bacterium]